MEGLSLIEVNRSSDRGPGIGASTFSAADLRDGLTVMQRDSVSRMPHTDQYGIDIIQREALLLADSIQATSASLPRDAKAPQISLMLDALALVGESRSSAEVTGRFETSSFVIDLALNMAAKLGRLEAAKKLNVETASMPAGSYDTFVQMSAQLIMAIKSAFNLRQKSDKAWDEILNDARQQELEKMKRQIEERRKYSQ